MKLYFENNKQVSQAIRMMLLNGAVVAVSTFNMFHMGTKHRNCEIIPFTFWEHLSQTAGGCMMGLFFWFISFPLGFWSMFGVVDIYDVYETDPIVVLNEGAAILTFWMILFVGSFAIYKFKSKVIYWLIFCIWMFASARWLGITLAMLNAF